MLRCINSRSQRFQRLGDYIREAGYDSVRYPSTLSPEATNVVFFDPAVADVGESKLVTITEVGVTYEDHDPCES